MTKALFILTGASRGMGLAMAQQLLKPDHFLLCISRNTHENLAAQAGQCLRARLAHRRLAHVHRAQQTGERG
jgi:NAD(P)-dependent dehydrogenase (short-subunit alcohol dehydrogenase family)